MKIKSSARALALFMAVVMMISNLSIPVYAADSETEISATSEVALTDQVVSLMETILASYNVASDMTDDQIASAITNNDDETIINNINKLDELAEQLSDAEAEAVSITDVYATYCRFYALYEEINTPSLLGGSASVLGGQVSVSASGDGKCSESAGVVTSSIKAGKYDILGKETTVTIINENEQTEWLSFDYSVSNQSKFKINGTVADSKGSIRQLLNANEKITFTLAASKNTTATIVFSNFALEEAASTSNVTFVYDNTLGTITVNEAAVSSGDVKEVSLSDGAVLKANESSGSTFLGWTLEDGTILSTEATYTLNVAEDTTVKAAFAKDGGTPWFSVGGKEQKSEGIGLAGLTKRYYYVVSKAYLFDDLNQAAACANENATKTLVLMNNAVLPAGEYTIPAGVELLIPFDDANTMYMTEAVSVAHTSYTKPTAYRTLTMEDGANLTVNGVVSLSAKHAYAHGGVENGGSPTGNVSFINMKNNSNIVVNNGGFLYVYGFITGSGNVTIKSGATVYENFQIMDFRGGSQSTAMENGVFPLSQYYIQNVEVPMTLEYGSKEYSYTSIYMTKSTFASSIAFIAADNAMFNLTSGSITKRYDGETDRLVIEANGNLTVSPIKMTIGTTSINSKNYELPINGNISVTVNSGNTITIGQDIAMLPGAEIAIENGATCVLGNNVNIYIYDAGEWGTYCGSGNKKLIRAYAPGQKYTRTEKDLTDATIRVDGVVDASKGYAYTTKGGANVYSNGTGVVKMQKGTQTETYQLIYHGENNVEYPAIPLTPAKLKNANGEYLAEFYSVNNYVDGEWKCGHILSKVDAKTATCEEDGNIEYYSCSDCKRVFEDAQAAKEITSESVIIKASGHKTKKVEAKDAACGEAGNIEHYICENKNCGKLFEDKAATKEIQASDVVIAAKNHETEKVEAKAATCEKDGNIEYYDCKNCDKVFSDSTATSLITKDSTVIKATGHKIKKIEAKAATCEKVGYIEHYMCENQGCNELFSDAKAEKKTTLDKVVIKATGHNNLEKVEAKQPTNSVAGNIEYYVCKNEGCGKLFSDETAKKELTQEDVVLSPLNHHLEKVEAKAATCEEDGNKEHYRCTDEGCGKLFADADATKELQKKDVVISAIKHKLDKVKAENVTCEKDGNIEYYKCTNKNCGKLFTDAEAKNSVAQKDVVIAATGHKLEKVEATSATCEKAGNIEYHKCTNENCGKLFTDAEATNSITAAEVVLKALGHKWDKGTVTTEPTCAKKGTTTFKCTNEGCNDTKEEDIDKLAHTEAVLEEEIPALCETAGTKPGKYCSVCNEVLEGMEEIPALGHDITKYPAKKPTYSNVGWEAYEKCSRCSYTTYVEIPKLETPEIADYDTFMVNLEALEEIAALYVKEENPEKDPLELVIKYIRTGVERYNSGSWNIMAGYEDEAFAKYVAKMEDAVNSEAESEAEMLQVTGLKKIKNFTLPNGQITDFGHMFGTMDITYTNKGSMNHADVGGWAGDIVDLVELADYYNPSGTMEEIVSEITNKYLLKDLYVEKDGEKVGVFSNTDFYGDLDGYYILNELSGKKYKSGDLTTLMNEYFTADLTDENRAAYLLKNRLGDVSTKEDVRKAVYKAYTGNKMIATLEGTRVFLSGNLDVLREAGCYAFADMICRLAGDYVEAPNNSYYEVFSRETSTLAPGITQDIKYATSADGKQMVYYIATADITRDDVNVYANYNENDPSKGWKMSRVQDQMQAAQDKYGNPESEQYIENYNVIAGINADGFNMSTGEPSGLLVMNGVTYHPVNNSGFFAILNNGKAVIGATAKEWEQYKNQAQEAVGGFGTILVKDGKVAITRTEDYYSKRNPRTAVGITRTGKVVFMVLDGRQEPYSCGGSMEEIAQIMLEAGCVDAINLDGGGSTTYVSKAEGADVFALNNKPSDGFQRSVSSSLMLVSTAPSSTAFDHAVVESDKDYMTIGSKVQLTVKGVSATGNAAELPEGTSWVVNDEKWGEITEDGVLTAKRLGDIHVSLMLGDQVLGTHTIQVVNPDKVYFTKKTVDVVYGSKTTLPVKVMYDGSEVAYNANDLVFTIANEKAGKMEGLDFVAGENTSVKKSEVIVSLSTNSEVTGKTTVYLYNQGEATFDFDQATNGDRLLAWNRTVTNATTEDGLLYTVTDKNKKIGTSYMFAMDMTQIPIPEQLSDLVYMLPGADTEGASAWTFLMQLAERVSDLTEVKASIKIDPNYDVVFSELKVINEYFSLEKTEFDETTNTLTLTLKWKKQTQAINPDEANPILILSGLNLSLKKDADWDAKDKLAITHSGEISYKIYLRASALYSFAQSKENQETYGLYPFVNPSNSSEKGAYFSSVYHKFTDSYEFDKSVKDGWVVEDGGYAYYTDGEKLTGIQKIDGFYYDFGENGINEGKSKYSGLFLDNTENVYRYAQNGELSSGWKEINGDWHYFDPDTMAAKTGFYMYYDLDETGKVESGAWVRNANGIRYYYGPSYYRAAGVTTVKFVEIDGKEYGFDKKGYRYTNGKFALYPTNDVCCLYEFDENGQYILSSGVHEGYLFKEGIKVTGYQLVEYGGDYYFINDGNKVAANTSLYLSDRFVSGTKFEVGRYYFDENGKMILDGIVDGCFYKDGSRVTGCQLFKYKGSYYFINDGYKIATNTSLYLSERFVSGTKFEVGRYYFDESGKMILDGVVGEYFYKNGLRVTGYQLVEHEGNYYFISDGNKIAKNVNLYLSDRFVAGTSFKEGKYYFDETGKMFLNGILDDCFYKDGIKVTGYELIKYMNDYYFIDNGKIVKNTNLYLGDRFVAGTSFKEGKYYFDETGKMFLDGILDGYFYKNGIKVTGYQLVEYEGNYYFINDGNKIATDTNLYLSDRFVIGTPFKEGKYYFDETGKMFLNGILDGYFYKNGIKVTGYQLVEYDGDYYFINDGNKVAMNTSLYLSERFVSGTKFEVGRYYFDETGKMFLNGIWDGYFYKNGIKVTGYQLVEYDGDYYFINDGNKVAVNTSLYLSERFVSGTKFEVGRYYFDETGKMYKDGPINGYFYRNGKIVKAYQLVEYEGNYYFINDGNKLVVNGRLYLTERFLQGKKYADGSYMEYGYYNFDASGKMIY